MTTILNTLRIMVLSTIGVFALPLAIMAQEKLPSCEQEVMFYKRHAEIVASERDRYIQAVTHKDMQIGYLKQQLEQMKKTKAQTQEKQE